MKKLILLGLMISAVIYADNIKVKRYTVDAGRYRILYNGKEKEFLTGLIPGYGSSLEFKSMDKNGNLEFYGITDRGPNTDIPVYMKDGKELPGKFFPVPDFTPSIGIIKIKGGKAEVTDSIPLKNRRGEKISGRVIPPGIRGATNETALNMDMEKLSSDFDGLDTEGITVDEKGNFWIADEYGPFIVKADSYGRIEEKYGPAEGLPEILKYRVPNKGFEGITIDEKGELYAILQSPLNIEGKTEKTAQYIRIVKLNLETKETAMYAYPIDNGYKDSSQVRIGDIHSIGNGKFLVIEQGMQNGKQQNLIYMADINEADILKDNGELEYGKEKVKPVKKELVLDLRKYGWNIENAEGVVLLPDRKTIAVVNDNEFGIKTKVNDSENQNGKLEDYTYDADRKEFLYRGKKAGKVKMEITSSSENERESQLWLFEMDRDIVK